MSAKLKATLFSDPACPWAYSASPALRVIEWRYREQIDWRLVLIGLSETTERHAETGFTPTRTAQGQLKFRERYGMPFSAVAKSRLSASSRACRAVVAARLQRPGSEWAVFRALQLANFNTPLIFDDDDQLRGALAEVAGSAGIVADQIVAALDSPAVLEAYQADRALARTAAGSPTELQGKTANSDGAVRYTAPSVIFELNDGGRIIAGGFQPVEAYDLAVTNLDPTLARQPPATDAAAALARFPLGLCTQEVAELMRADLEPPDRTGAEVQLIELVAAGRVRRRALGDDAIWTAAE